MSPQMACGVFARPDVQGMVIVGLCIALRRDCDFILVYSFLHVPCVICVSLGASAAVLASLSYFELGSLGHKQL